MFLPGQLPFFVLFFFSPTCVSDIVMKAHIPSCILSFLRHHIRMVYRLQALHFLSSFHLSFLTSYYLLLTLSSSLDKTSVHLYCFFLSMS